MRKDYWIIKLEQIDTQTWMVSNDYLKSLKQDNKWPATID